VYIKDIACQMCELFLEAVYIVVFLGDSKADIRNKVWDYLTDNRLASFPFPPHRRISNFKVCKLILFIFTLLLRRLRLHCRIWLYDVTVIGQMWHCLVNRSAIFRVMLKI